ncbi:MAG: DUF1844 domain-containing protein [Pseudomonadota bacterium]
MNDVNFTLKKEQEKQKEELKDSGLTFSSFIFSLSSSALISLGQMANPLTNEVEKNLELAKQNIDILSIIKDKTKSNLTEDEEKLLSDILYNLRMKYLAEK